METIMTFVKENDNLMGLFLVIIGVVIVVISVVDELKKVKDK